MRMISDKYSHKIAEASCYLTLAGLAMLIVALAVDALSPNVFAAEPGKKLNRKIAAGPNDNKGLPAGSRPFGAPAAGNPFAPPARAGNPAPAYFEDEEDDFGFPEDLPPPRGNIGYTPPAAVGGGGYTPPGSGGAAYDPGGTSNAPTHSVGGGLAGGVITKNNPKPLRVDDDTAEGSKEIITDFNFPDADILDIAKALGKLTGKNFILEKDVKGRITIISNGPITVGDAWRAFLTALDINHFALIPSGKFIRIARDRDARDKQLKTYTGEYAPDTDAIITRVFQLKYLSAEEVAKTFRNFMPAQSRIIPYEQTNTVIVTDTGSNIAKLQKLLDIMDIEGYDAGIEVIPVKYASAAELSKLIDQLIPGTGAAPGAPGGAGRFGAGRFNSRRTKEGGIINTIFADERTNTLIVHANTKGADQVRELVAKLDQKLPAATGGGKIHVIYLQFAEAEAIANTLNTLTQSSGTRPAGGAAGSGTGVNPVQTNLFEGSIKVSPDKATNSLVITASPQDFATVQRVLSRLDIPRDQVYAEVVIMEIQLDRGFEYSTNIINPTNGLGLLTKGEDLLQAVTSPLAQKGAVLAFASGNKVEVNVGGTKQQISSITGLIKLLQTNSNANVVATPQILAMDNFEATFESAEVIPVKTSTVSQGQATQGIGTKDISTKIVIKPQINKALNMVKLDITTQIEDFSGREPAALAGEAYATTKRSAKTSVMVGDSDTVVIGGLVRDAIKEKVSKVPILGDIPLLGWLFRSKSSESSKSNMMVFITPHIIRQYDNLRSLLDKKLAERDDFIERNAGGNDPHRSLRDNIIRSLPDVEGIKRPRVQTIQTIDENDAATPVPYDSSENLTPPKKSKPQLRAQAPKVESQNPPPAPDASGSAAPPVAPTAPTAVDDAGGGGF